MWWPRSRCSSLRAQWRGRSWCWPPEPGRRSRWAGCAPWVASWRSGSRSWRWTSARRARCWRVRGCGSPRRRRPRSSGGPRGGRSGCTWPRCRSRRGAPAAPKGSGSAGMTGSWPTTCGRSCWPGYRQRRCRSSPGRRCWTACAGRCATPSSTPAGRPRSWSRWRGQISSSSRWTVGGSGTATITCSVNCSPPSWSGGSRSWCRSCIGGRRSGARPTASPRPPSTTPRRPATPTGSLGWSPV